MLLAKPNRCRGEGLIHRSRLWRCILILSLGLFLISKNIFAQTQKIPPLNEEVLKGIGFIYNWEFDLAESLFDRMIKEKPEDPMGHFYFAMVSWSRLVSGTWTKEMVRQYRERINRTIDVANAAVNKNKNDCFAYFYLGGALGFEGRFKLTEEKYLASFFLARDAIKALKTSKEMCPDNIDILFGLGIFDYYTARLSGVLKFLSYLLIHKGDKEEGLRKLHSVAEGVAYSSIEAKSLLLHTYLFMEDDRFDRARDLAVELTRRFRDNPRFKYLEGISYIRLDKRGEYREALKFFQEKSIRSATERAAFMWSSYGTYLEISDDLFHNRNEGARTKAKSILSKADPVSNPSMIAWPLLKMGMSYDLELEREKALDYYHQVKELENSAGAQFLAERYIRNSVKPTDPFLGY